MGTTKKISGKAMGYVILIGLVILSQGVLPEDPVAFAAAVCNLM